MPATIGKGGRLQGGSTTRSAHIASLATFVPPRILTNTDLEKLVDTSDAWILKRTGIRERHVVDPGTATSDLAKEASLAAIAQAGLTPEDIGFIVVATTTPDMFFPSTACLLQKKIGAVNAWGFDLGAACSGFTYALTTATQDGRDWVARTRVGGGRRCDVVDHRLQRPGDVRAFWRWRGSRRGLADVRR